MCNVTVDLSVTVTVNATLRETKAQKTVEGKKSRIRETLNLLTFKDTDTKKFRYEQNGKNEKKI